MSPGKCELCGKHTQFGRAIQHRHSGAWRRKAPKTNREFRPNVHKRKMFVDGRWRRVNVCTRCMRTEMKKMQDAGVPYAVQS